jgi:hypothetical protein
MNQELQNTLFEKYPQLFSNTSKSRMESCMCWGIECNDGWYEILSSVCWRIFQHEQNISERIAVRNKCGTPNDQSDLDYVPVKFDQIKEKFGGLRIYFSGGDDYVEGIVSMAEEMSYKICEVCGNSGKPNKGGWITTLCNSCKNKDKEWIPPEFPG